MKFQIKKNSLEFFVGKALSYNNDLVSPPSIFFCAWRRNRHVFGRHFKSLRLCLATEETQCYNPESLMKDTGEPFISPSSLPGARWRHSSPQTACSQFGSCPRRQWGWVSGGESSSHLGSDPLLAFWAPSCDPTSLSCFSFQQLVHSHISSTLKRNELN